MKAIVIYNEEAGSTGTGTASPAAELMREALAVAYLNAGTAVRLEPALTLRCMKPWHYRWPWMQTGAMGLSALPRVFLVETDIAVLPLARAIISPGTSARRSRGEMQSPY